MCVSGDLTTILKGGSAQSHRANPRAEARARRTTLQAASCQSEWLKVAEPSQLRLQIVALTLSFVVAPSRGTEIVARFSFTRLLDASCTAVPVPFDAVNS